LNGQKTHGKIASQKHPKQRSVVQKSFTLPANIGGSEELFMNIFCIITVTLLNEFYLIWGFIKREQIYALFLNKKEK
jgi:hypothetical protein